MAQTKEYTVEMHKLFLEMMLQDAESYIRVQNIYNPKNFDKSLQPVAEFVKEHVDKHKAIPTLDQVYAVTKVKCQ